jgi:glycosyltransferase involved in cell wall biosynthesis
MKIAIPCAGLDHVNRGFESFARELFENLRGHCDAHLVKSSGCGGANIHVLQSLRRDAAIYRWLPSSYFNEYRRYRNECVTFGLRFLLLAMRENYDIVHFSDSVFGDFLLRARKVFGLKFKLICSNGAPWSPEFCSRFDAVQQVSAAHYEAGLRLLDSKSFLVPYGIDTVRLKRPADFDRAAIRRNHGIPANAFVVVSLAALNRTHKRLDWLISEFAKISSPDFFLAMAGSRDGETPEVERIAASMLPPDRHRFFQLPYDEIPALLWASDAVALCSLDEGFGRVLAEAMAAEVPLLVHPHGTARWIVKSADSFVDMTVPGALAEKIRALASVPLLRAGIVKANSQAVQMFDWQALVPQYLRMYETVLKA